MQTESRTFCPECGRLIPPNAPLGLCALCVIRMVLEGLPADEFPPDPGGLEDWLVPGIGGSKDPGQHKDLKKPERKENRT